MKFSRIIAILCILVLPLALVAQDEGEAAENQEEKSKLSPGTFSGLTFRNIGPALMSGRISDIVIVPENPSTWYVAAGSGNVWKTENSGTTWQPIFDRYGSYSVGAIAIDPNNSNVLWVGTGENVDGRHVGYGDGIYKSMDGGKSFKNMGLKESEHISRIQVDPRDGNVVYVAAKGPLWSSGGERGIYKTIDGGETWELILEGENEWTGANDIVLDPVNPDIMYAAMHQRHRTVAALINGGPGSGIYKSMDAGANWRKVSSGLPSADMGRIGLAVSPQQPNVVYATVELAGREGGFYRSTDHGESWERRNTYISGGTGPHYYQEIFASPHAFDRVYQMDVQMRWTEDGGRTFSTVGELWKHVDNHALAFNPDDPDYLLAGCDGGLYESWDLGQNWKFIGNLPLTQFYKVAVDNRQPFYNVYGGTQDNNTQGGPSATLNVHGIRNADWFVTLFGDGHQPATDPEYNDIIYSHWQQGNLVRYDHKTGEIVYIQPQPAPGEPAERWNWDSPILVSPHDAATIYHGSRRVWKSENRGDSWEPISEDLSRGLDRLTMPMMGRIWSIDAVWDLFAMSNFGNLTSLSESPLVEGLMYAGSDDGLVHVTEDGGQTWRRAGEMPDVPEFAFVNDIKADLHDPDTVYICLDNHKEGDFKPYVLKSTDRGQSWTSIADSLPDRHIVWRLVQDHVKKELMFLATEFGIFFTIDGGEKWIQLKGGLPVISFRDLVIQQRENDLVAASFGRSFYILDDYSPLRDVTEEMLTEGTNLFPVKDALYYIQRRVLGGSEKASQGSDYFTAPNPPYGAVFTYYMAESLQTAQQERQKAEAKAKKEGEDTPYPGFDTLREEGREESPAMVLTIRDSNGTLVRRLSGPARAGFHRIAWDMRYPSHAPQFFGGGGGFLAAPGTFTVSLATWQDGELTEAGQPQQFTLTPLYERGTLPQKNTLAERRAFMEDVAALQRAVMGTAAAMAEANETLDAMISAMDRSALEDISLRAQARDMLHRLADHRAKIFSDPVVSGTGTPTPPGVMGRIQTLLIGNTSSLYGPTEHHLQNLEWAKEQFAEIHPDIKKIIEEEIPALREALDAAGVVWTPGSGVPALP